MTNSTTKAKASCHCGSVHLDINLTNGLEEIVRCNCSICSRGKGFGMVCVPLENVKIIQGASSITEYTFKSNTAPHFFCKFCGTYTHHKSRARPDKFCINLSCIAGVNIHDFKHRLVAFNGVNHPKDD